MSARQSSIESGAGDWAQRNGAASRSQAAPRALELSLSDGRTIIVEAGHDRVRIAGAWPSAAGPEPVSQAVCGDDAAYLRWAYDRPLDVVRAPDAEAVGLQATLPLPLPAHVACLLDAMAHPEVPEVPRATEQPSGRRNTMAVRAYWEARFGSACLHEAGGVLHCRDRAHGLRELTAAPVAGGVRLSILLLDGSFVEAPCAQSLWRWMLLVNATLSAKQPAGLALADGDAPVCRVVLPEPIAEGAVVIATNAMLAAHDALGATLQALAINTELAHWFGRFHGL